MEKLFILALLIAGLYCSIKIIEMKYVTKEWKPLKTVIRDAVVVLISSVAAIFAFNVSNGSITDFFNIVTDNAVLNPSATEVFTGDPGF
jgi:hypothetical protein